MYVYNTTHVEDMKKGSSHYIRPWSDVLTFFKNFKKLNLIFFIFFLAATLKQNSCKLFADSIEK